MKSRKQTKSVWLNQRMTVLWVALSTLLAGSVSAETFTWSTNTTGAAQDGTGAWNNTVSNWVGAGDVHVLWNNANGDTAIFGAGGVGGTVTSSSGITIGGLTFNAISNVTYTLAGTLILTNVPTITANTNATISSILSGSAGVITTTGAGTLTLGGANTFTGNLVVAGGTLRDTLAANNNNPTATGLGNMTTVGRQIQVNNGATLLFANNDSIGSAVVLQNTSFVVDGGIVNHSNYFVTMPNILLMNGATLTGGNGVYPAYQTYNLMGSVTVSGTSGSTITTTGSSLTGIHLGNGNNLFLVNPTGSDPDLTVSAPLVNRPGSLAASGFIKAGAGKMMLTADNAFTGGVTISNGVLQVGNGGATGTIGTGAVGVNLVNADASLVFNRSGTLTQSGAISGNGSLLKQGTGVLTLSVANTYSGGTTVSNGTLVATTASSLPGYATAGKVTVGSGAGLAVTLGNWSNADITSLANSGAYTSGSLFVFDTTAGNFTYTGQFTLPALAGLLKIGPNMLTITGVNTSTGSVTVLGGILQADFGTGIPATTNVVLNNGSLSSSSGSITASLGTGAGQITVTPNSISGFSAFNTPLTVNLGGAGEPLSWGSSLFNPSAFVLNDTGANTNLTLQNAIALNSASRTITVNAAVAEISGVISNGSVSAALVKDGAGTLKLTAANTFTGGTTLNAGTLALLGGDNRLSTNGAITVNNGTLDLGGGTQTTTGAVTFVSGLLTNGTLSKSGAAYDVRSGTIAAKLLGSVGLTKTTPGTLTLTSTNIYTGNTRVNAGILNIPAGGALFGTDLINPVSGGVLTIAGAVTVTNNGAFGVGSGTLGLGTVNIETGALVSIGNGSGGYAGRTYIAGKLDGTGSLGAGTLNINGGVLSVAAGGTGVTGDASSFWLNAWGNGGAMLNLNGGMLSTARQIQDGAGASGPVHFNGGTLQAAANLTPILNGVTAIIDAGGAKIDTQNYAVSIPLALSHGTGSPDGGLTKLGSGVLTLSGKSSYNGTTVISNGTLRLGVANAITNTGAVRVEGGIYDLNGFIVTNGTVTLNSGSIINGSLNASSFTLSDSGTLLANVDGGTLTKSGSGTAILYGGNTCTGLTSVTQGTLTLAKLGLANCRLHLDASNLSTLFTNATGVGPVTSSGQPVGYWGDLSGNNKPAKQSTLANRPTYVKNVAEFNGQSVLQFDGSDDDLTSLLDINATNIPNMTVIMIFRQVTYKTNGGLWGHDDGAWDRLQLLNFGGTGNNNIAGNNNSIVVKGMNTNAVMLYAAVLKNGVANSSYVYINGVSDGNSGLAFTSQENAPYGLTSFTIGNISPGNAYRGNIQIGEVLVFDTALTDTPRRNVETYLKNKWLGASDPITPFLPTNGAVQVASGAVLNLDGASHTVASVSGEGVLSNGSLTATGTISPAGESIGTLKVSNVALSGTLRVNVAMDGSNDQLASTGNLSLTGLTLQIADTGLLNWQKSYTLVTCSGSLTGELTASLPNNWKIKYDRTAGTATLVYISPGSMVRFM
jgi:autotransporter-associated beta strand protein